MRNKKEKKLIQAFTIAEIIIYIAVFSIFFVGIVATLSQVNAISSQETRTRDLNNTVLFLQEHFQTSFNNSQEIEIPNYPNNNPGSTQELQLGNILQGSTSSTVGRILYYYDYKFANNKISFYTGTSTIVPTIIPKDLTDTHYATVVSANFYPIPDKISSLTPAGIKVIIVLQSPSDSSIQVTMQNTYLI